ncbi:MAG: 1-acyl-sn-glycerol-3-phosphate acyltransferase [Clostridia bacterium]|nr:1-acyl-sn-glycerol-3-phosphate acyltransferase [Clostridia bacterium]
MAKNKLPKNSNKFYIVAHKLVARGVLRLFRVKIEGGENLPAEGGFIYCSNHICALDPIMVCGAGRTQVHYMAKKELFKIPVLSALIRALGAFPVNRGGADVGAIRRAIELLQAGESVGIFIQGHRYPGVPLRETKPKNGAVMIAVRSGAPILPICIKTKGNRFSMFKPTRLIIGKPISVAELGLDEHASGEFSRASQAVFDEICRLEESSADA